MGEGNRASRSQFINRPQHRFRRGGGMQIRHRTIIAARRHRIAHRVERRHRQHQRRLADRLRAMDRVLAIRFVLENRTLECAGAVAHARDLVRRRRMRRELAVARSSTAPRIVSQPTPWMKPPSIWPRSIAGLSDVPTSCRMSTRSTLRLAGQRVDRDFRHRRAVREVEERPAGAASAVLVDLRRRVEARRPTAARARGTRSSTSSRTASRSPAD